MVASRTRAHRASRIARFLACCVTAACGGRSVETIEVPASGTTLTVAGSPALGGSPSSSGGTASSTAGGGTAGNSPARGGASAGGAGCVSAEACPAPMGRCAYATCDHGACAVANVAAGALVVRDSPADCFDSVCDGNGGEMKIVDLENIPSPANACSVTGCDGSGSALSSPALGGVSCMGQGGAKLCDGAGNCVACLGDADCETGERCVANVCAAASCSDGFKDHDETDIDCGGSCAPCARTKDCLLDADCASGACDSLPPHRCLADQCVDHHKNGLETDVDCGGPACAKCTDGRNCKADLDCAAGYCDAKRGYFCEAARCLNGMLDGTETDLDCGGGICDGCALGQKCLLYFDCASSACDGVSRTCVADHCTDHNWDGDETFPDCGGSCAPCTVGERCVTNADCQTGHSCAPGNPHVCQ